VKVGFPCLVDGAVQGWGDSGGVQTKFNKPQRCLLNIASFHLIHSPIASQYQNNRQGSYFVTFTGGMHNPYAHGERVRFGFYRLLFDDKK
jgi:hypothetical protein